MAFLEKVLVINFDAAVHYHKDPLAKRHLGRLVMNNALLHPNGRRERMQSQCLFDNSHNLRRFSENIDNIDGRG